MTSPSTPVAGDFRRLAERAASHVAPLRRHRAITHVVTAATALAVAVAVAIPAAPAIRAGLLTAPREGSILPANVGVGIATASSVVLRFPGPMNEADVSAHLGLAPRTDYVARWSADGQTLTLLPRTRWATDERYAVYVPAGTAMADGGALAADWRAAFTTQTAPRVVDLQVTTAPGTPTADTPIVIQEVMASVGSATSETTPATDDVAPDASAATVIGMTFSAAMDPIATELAFRISPAVSGSFRWEGTTMWFTPDQRLAAGSRYAINLVGARDADGNRLGGDTSFSFETRAGSRAVTVTPAIGARGVTGKTVTIRFSEPMDTAATGAAFRLNGARSGQRVAGTVAWSADGQTLTFNASSGLLAGGTYVASLASGALDADGNPVSASWRFTMAGGATRTFTPTAAVPANGDMVVYALNQVNAARAAYGLAPLTLDPAISAVAYGHAYDMLVNGYFSHDSLDGTTYKQRLTAGGISYGYSGENQCYLNGGGGVKPTLDWCHAQFMAEPYPGYANHKGNILSTHFRRIGIGIAVGGSKVIVVWDFTD